MEGNEKNKNDEDSRKNIFFLDKAGPVAAPVAASPPGALVEELGAVLKGSLQLALALVLNPSLPLVADEPASDKVVVVGVEDVLAPLLGLEALKKIVARENFGPVGTGSARHARGTSIDVVGSGDLKVASLNVSCSQPVEDAGGPRTIPDALNSLASTDTTDLRVFEGSQNPRHEGGGPGYVVIGHDGDLGGDLGQGFTDLQTLVRDWGRVDLDIGVRKAVGKLLQRSVLLYSSNKHQGMRFAGQDTEKRRAQFLKDIVNSWDDDGNIVCGEGWLAGDRLGFVYPVADAVDKKANVAMKPVKYVRL